MAVIQIRGTSGSGKTFAMRRVMEGIEWDGQFQKGRKKPLYYHSVEPQGIVVLGHYESQCGGCDTIGSAAVVYNLIQTLSDQLVLCEGLLLSEDVKWSLQLKDLRVLYLTTPVERCLHQVQQRRLFVGNNKPLNHDNTVNRVAVIERSRVKLEEAGVYCRRCTADQAPGIV